MRNRLGVVSAMLLLGSGCAASYEADLAPPPHRIEVYAVSPGPGFVWRSGYWSLGGGDYYWVPGRWARPPHGRQLWVADRWERRGNRWRLVRGYWR